MTLHTHEINMRHRTHSCHIVPLAHCLVDLLRGDISETILLAARFGDSYP